MLTPGNVRVEGLSHGRARASVGARAGLILAALCLISSACGSKEDASSSVDSWLYFRETDGEHERYLSITVDGRYESAVLDEHATRAGELDAAQQDHLRALVSEQLFDAYAAEATSDCESKTKPIMVVEWREEREGKLSLRTGCWVRADVASAETQEFLDTFSDLQVSLMK